MRTAILLLLLSLIAVACASPGMAPVGGSVAPEGSALTPASTGSGEVSLDIAELI